MIRTIKAASLTFLISGSGFAKSASNLCDGSECQGRRHHAVNAIPRLLVRSA